MIRSLVETLAGDTLIATWVNSGASPTTIVAALFTGSETIVSSVTMTSSGNGHFFQPVTIPGSGDAYYVLETYAVIDTYPYKRRIKIHALGFEVD